MSVDYPWRINLKISFNDDELVGAALLDHDQDILIDSITVSKSKNGKEVEVITYETELEEE